MNAQGVAKAFARALLDAALQAETGEAVRLDVLRLQEEYRHTPELRAYFSSHHLSTPNFREEVVCALWKETLQPCTMLAIRQMARWDALSLFPLFLKAFESLFEKAMGVHVAKAEFALAPTEEEVGALQKKLEGFFSGGSVCLQRSTNAELLAGFRVDVEDVSVDASLQGRLRRMTQRP